MSKWLLRFVGLGAAAVCATGFVATIAYADSLQSSNYRFEESVIGGSGLLESSSENYTVTDLLGDTAIGNSASENFQIDAGHVTTNDPALSFTINSPSVSFDPFTASSATVATASFSVSNYTSYGYAVQVIGTAPSNNGHDIPAMATTDESQAGTEQFGINLVANSDPVSFGANPAHGLFGIGTAAPNYGTPDRYRFVNGETIALGPKSSGVTTYTISYIVNVHNLTPGGQYHANQVLVCTGTY